MSLPPISRELLARYATSAPRYTSYPTAVDWSAGFDPARYPELLAEAALAKEPLSVYVHVPFCAELCLFCGCNVVITRNAERVATYVESLEREFARVRASGIGRRPVRQYHWGGGTPTHLSPSEIERLQAAFLQTFALAEDAEVAIEVDPRVTTRQQIELLARLGFNRISLGIQDFDPAVQQAIKRVQSEAETRAVIDAARDAGMVSVNVDLIYGLPLQTIEGFERTVERVLDIRPDRVALFHYAHVPWMKPHQTALDVEAAPSSETKLEIFTRAVERFRSGGYAYIGLDHFALPEDELAIAHRQGTLQRNFMGYTTRRGSDMIPVGVSAIGEVAGCFVQNQPKEREYEAAIAAGGTAVHRGHELTPDDRLRRDVILGLMCRGQVEKRAVEAEHGVRFDTVFAEELALLAPLEQDGLVRLEPDAVRLTELGQVFMRNVAVVFDRYYRERQARGEDSRRTFSRTL